jgi:hypothetical protein
VGGILGGVFTGRPVGAAAGAVIGGVTGAAIGASMTDCPYLCNSHLILNPNGHAGYGKNAVRSTISPGPARARLAGPMLVGAFGCAVVDHSAHLPTTSRVSDY